MPELPEVETVRRSLAPLCGKKIIELQFSKLAPVETTTPKKIREALLGTMVTSVDRWGKYLLISVGPVPSENLPSFVRRGRGEVDIYPSSPPLTKGRRLTDSTRGQLVIHLGMTGQLRLVERSGAAPHHTHMELRFADGSLLRYRDTRRFGTISLSQTGDGQDNPLLHRLGPDYLDPKLTPEIYVQRCRQHPGLNLKNLLLHQGVAAGLGNIYACEALYRAGLNPKQRVKRTKEASLIQLLLAVREILGLGIHHGGTTLRDYLDGLGNRGRMKEFLQVYDRKGLPTLDGRGQVIRIVQGNRATWYCPAVQK